MSIDLIIWLLFFIGVGFGLIGLIGLLLFPDTRSRMYTSVRATLIGIGSAGLAVFIYGLYAQQTSGGNQYVTLILHTLILIVAVATGNYVVSRIILEKTRLHGEKLSEKEK
jgi:multicomponent Na+:H+ antiporter subunit G